MQAQEANPEILEILYFLIKLVVLIVTLFHMGLMLISWRQATNMRRQITTKLGNVTILANFLQLIFIVSIFIGSIFIFFVSVN